MTEHEIHRAEAAILAWAADRLRVERPGRPGVEKDAGLLETWAGELRQQPTAEEQP